MAEFSLQRIAAEILLGQLNEKGATEEDVKEVLRQAFISAEKGYLDSIDSNLARKTVLQCELEGLSQYEVRLIRNEIAVRQSHYLYLPVTWIPDLQRLSDCVGSTEPNKRRS